MQCSSKVIQELLAVVRGHVLESAPRLGVMLLLYARGTMEFNELQRELGLKPGTLWSHLCRLKERGMIKVYRKLTLKGPRLVVEATDKGLQETIRYVEAYRRLLSCMG